MIIGKKDIDESKEYYIIWFVLISNKETLKTIFHKFTHDYDEARKDFDRFIDSEITKDDELFTYAKMFSTVEAGKIFPNVDEMETIKYMDSDVRKWKIKNIIGND